MDSMNASVRSTIVPEDPYPSIVDNVKKKEKSDSNIGI